MDVYRAARDRTQHLCAVVQPGPAPSVLAMAAASGADLDRGRQDRGDNPPGDLLARLGPCGVQYLPDQPLPAARADPGVHAAAWQANAGGAVPYSAALQ